MNYNRKDEAQSMDLNDKVMAIRDNDIEINLLIEEYKPFIAACAGKASGRYVRYGEDDELSIALMAFVEAIRAYDAGKGNFLPFSSKVIKRRIIDYYRKEKKHEKVLSINQYSGEEDDSADITAGRSFEIFNEEKTAEMRRIEIGQLREELASWGISFSELAASSPKHKKTKQVCNEIVSFILSDKSMIAAIKGKRQLPVADIENTLQIPRKIIEKSRRYIISVIIIATGDYQYVREYVNLGGRA
ncbi:MAG: RNA polymerase sigma-I factor [Clostridiales bacterium]|nr:RNA polymerase sigma-I factor [Clostridiales bacterium]